MASILVPILVPMFKGKVQLAAFDWLFRWSCGI